MRIRRHLATCSVSSILLIAAAYPSVAWIGVRSHGIQPSVTGSSASSQSDIEAHGASALTFFGRTTESDAGSIQSAGVDGSNPTHLLDGGQYAWSADGQKVVYTGLQDSYLYTADRTGKDARLLGSGYGVLRNPAWSPNGKKIAFVPYPGYVHVNVINADGTHFADITPQSDSCWGNVLGVSWLSNTTVVFGNQALAGCDPAKYGGLFELNTSGGTPLRISTGDATTVMNPVVSPDHKNILFDDGARVYVVPAKGGPAKPITPSAQTAELGAWSPDGEMVAYVRRDPNRLRPNIFEVSAKGGPAMQLTKGLWAASLPGFLPGTTSILQLGDSIASGEGTLYGFSYDSNKKRWDGPAVKNPKWSGDWQLCHDSPDAYGAQVSRQADATFAQLACTGTSFFNGIVNANIEPDTKKQRGPAQFGDWAHRHQLNAAYDEAKPALVLVTLGADDVRFADIVADCITSTLPGGTLRCVPHNPGQAVQDDFLNEIPRIPGHLSTLVSWIEARGKAAKPAKVPKILFTNYYDPFPPSGGTCADTWRLKPAQVAYLSGLVHQLDSVIKNAVDPLVGKNIHFVDLSNAWQGHTWCTTDPLAYGLSIDSILSHDNPAPFHPTPAGQYRIARLLMPDVKQLLQLK